MALGNLFSFYHNHPCYTWICPISVMGHSIIPYALCCSSVSSRHRPIPHSCFCHPPSLEAPSVTYSVQMSATVQLHFTHSHYRLNVKTFSPMYALLNLLQLH